jgi:hypothetical protein
VNDQPARKPHPDPLAEQVLKDLEENQGWRITWDEAGDHLLVECPHGQYQWPVTLEPRWRWNDHFKRMMGEHREQCGA